MEINKNKDIIGMVFFVLSTLVLVYMFLTPLNHLVCHIDEYFTMTLTTLPISDILTTTTWDVHPPLHYLMGKAVAKICGIFGIDLLYGLKLLSIIPYILILIISATKIKKEYGWFAAGLFAFSLGVAGEFFRYYLIARMYSWAILFVLIVFLSFKDILNDSSNKKAWILITIFSVLAAYTHYFAAITSACIYLILLGYLITYEKEKLKDWGLSVAGAIILYIPWIFSLIHQLTQVHENFWIPEVNSEKIILFFGYYVYNTDIFFAFIGILILAAIIFIYINESKNLDKKDQLIILSGFGVYFGTIILGILISIIFKPILITRYLMPAAAVLWFTISIFLSKIEDKRMLLISFALICLVLISGIATIISTNEDLYESGTIQKEIMDNITQDNNSMLIINRQHLIMSFLPYATQTDMYCLNVGHVYGVNIDRLHNIYNFKTVNGTEVDNLIANNTNKNIYLISWKEPTINTPTQILDKEVEIVFSKVITDNITSN